MDKHLAASFNIRDVFTPAQIPGYGTTQGVSALATDIIQILTSFVAALCLIFIVVAGIKFVTASGDEKKLASAQATLTYAIIGLVVAILAFAIVEIVQYFLRSSVAVT